jgi:hypothetical protein
MDRFQLTQAGHHNSWNVVADGKYVGGLQVTYEKGVEWHAKTLDRGPMRFKTKTEALDALVATEAYERLLAYLGTTAREVEARGWARVGNGGFQCLFRLSRSQRERIEEAGLLVDDGAELIKPRWSES